MKIIREEIFGPVCAVIKFKTEEEVIELCQSSDFSVEKLQELRKKIR